VRKWLWIGISALLSFPLAAPSSAAIAFDTSADCVNNPYTSTVTFTNGSASIGWASNVLVAGVAVRLTTTGTLPTNFATGTTYYVISTGLSSSNFELSATRGGAAITAGSAGSGTQTAATYCLADAAIFQFVATIGASASDSCIGMGEGYGYNGPSVSSVSVGSASAATLQTAQDTSDFYKVLLWHAYSPTSGTSVITITLSTNIGTTSQFYAGLVSFTGSNTSALDNSGTTATASSNTSVSLNLTTNNANAVICDAGLAKADNATSTMTVGGSQTKKVNIGSTSTFAIVMSYQAVATAGSTADSAGYSASTNLALAAASIKPTVAAAAHAIPVVY